MANVYTQFSTMVENLTDAEREWVEHSLLAMEEEADNDGMVIGFNYGVEAEGLWIYSEEYGNPDDAADFIYAFLKVHRAPAVHRFEWAVVTSKPNVGGFGGGAVYIDTNLDGPECLCTANWTPAQLQPNTDEVGENVVVSFSVHGWVRQRVRLTEGVDAPNLLVKLNDGAAATSIQEGGDVVVKEGDAMKKIGVVVETLKNELEYTDFEVE